MKETNTHLGHEHSENSDEIVFSNQKAKHFGVETSIIKRGNFNDIIKVSGEILPAQGDESVISAKSSGILKLNTNAIEGKSLVAGTSIGYISSQNISGGDANEAARINYEAAKRELERITPLYKDKIITEREYNQVKQTYDNAKASLSNNSGAGSYATSNISGTLTKLYAKDGEYMEIGAPIGVVSKNAKLILKSIGATWYGLNKIQYSALFVFEILICRILSVCHYTFVSKFNSKGYGAETDKRAKSQGKII